MVPPLFNGTIIPSPTTSESRAYVSEFVRAVQLLICIHKGLMTVCTVFKVSYQPLFVSHLERSPLDSRSPFYRLDVALMYRWRSCLPMKSKTTALQTDSVVRIVVRRFLLFRHNPMDRVGLLPLQHSYETEGIPPVTFHRNESIPGHPTMLATKHSGRACPTATTNEKLAYACRPSHTTRDLGAGK